MYVGAAAFTSNEIMPAENLAVSLTWLVSWSFYVSFPQATG